MLECLKREIPALFCMERGEFGRPEGQPDTWCCWAMRPLFVVINCVVSIVTVPLTWVARCCFMPDPNRQLYVGIRMPDRQDGRLVVLERVDFTGSYGDKNAAPTQEAIEFAECRMWKLIKDYDGMPDWLKNNDPYSAAGRWRPIVHYFANFLYQNQNSVMLDGAGDNMPFGLSITFLDPVFFAAELEKLNGRHYCTATIWKGKGDSFSLMDSNFRIKQ